MSGPRTLCACGRSATTAVRRVEPPRSIAMAEPDSVPVGREVVYDGSMVIVEVRSAAWKVVSRAVEVESRVLGRWGEMADRERRTLGRKAWEGDG